jgi:hypothetical protein
MSIAIIGGMDRLKNVYERQAKALGYKVKFFGRKVPNLGKRISKVNGIVILTGMVAHHMVAEVNRTARLWGIPILHIPTSSAAGLKKVLAGFKP